MFAKISYYRFYLLLVVGEENNVFLLVCHLSACTVAQSNFVLFLRPKCPDIDFYLCKLE